MATARLSPAASLLRSSRLFSIPPPLIPPASLVSETATQPHPTHAAIETPPSSWNRGDWGFKRSLPLKSTTKTGTTSIRVQNGIDSIEHITDFESAADHVLTLQKWKELNMPIRFLRKRVQNESLSVFEPQLDNVSPSTTSSQRKWRHTGPWLSGQTGWEFDALLKRAMDRKSEFQTHLRTRLNAERNMSRRQAAIDAGADLDQEQGVEITDEEFSEHMHYLRETPPAFGPLIAEFLDLPEGPSSTTSTPSAESDFLYGRSTLAAELYKEVGPPKTHPSAGISYIRSGAHVFNHPIFGPQSRSPPVFARVLRPTIRRRTGEIGIAGFVVSGAVTSTILPIDRKPPIPGGAMLVLRPTSAAISSNGRVLLSADNASSELRRVYGFPVAGRLRDGRDSSKQPAREERDMMNSRMARMLPLDKKPDRETDMLYDALGNILRSSDGDYI